MMSIHVIDAERRHVTLRARAGVSLMRVATEAGVAGIAADCGGCLNCATCHVYVADEWLASLPQASSDEVSLLDLVAAERRASSRLACQIVIDASLDGLVVHLPDTQY